MVSLSGWFTEDFEERPVGKIEGASLVIPGSTHARLRNVSRRPADAAPDWQRTWLRTERFEWNGVEVVHLAGASTRGVLEPWAVLLQPLDAGAEMQHDVRRTYPLLVV